VDITKVSPIVVGYNTEINLFNNYLQLRETLR